MNAQSQFVIDADKQAFIYQQFKYLYQHYMNISRADLESIYSDKVTFKDPIDEQQGLMALQEYFFKVSTNLISCEFEFVNELVNSEAAYVTWNMHFQHPKIDSGKLTTLRGMTFIQFSADDGKITYHEDVYDVGAMLYERLPVIGRVTKWIKSRLG